MIMNSIDFLVALGIKDLSETERAIALLWFDLRAEAIRDGVTVKDLASQMVAAGYSKPNTHRLRQRLMAHRDLSVSQDRFRIKPNAIKKYDDDYTSYLEKPIFEGDEFIPSSLVAGTRKYLESIVLQINIAYNQKIYDCASVMMRKLIEILIIEVYESKGRSVFIKKDNGEFYMMSGLIGKIESDSELNLGRESKKSLSDIKSVGDRSAHNRRWLARKMDLDELRSPLRLVIEELLHLSQLV